MNWDDSCVPSDTDYEIYEGMLGSFSSHKAEVCSTNGGTAWMLTPAAESSYFIVVPRNVNREGSYGTNGVGIERPTAVDACLPQAMAPACR